MSQLVASGALVFGVAMVASIAGCPAPVASCTPGSTQTCVCSGVGGLQSCTASGVYGACVCPMDAGPDAPPLDAPVPADAPRDAPTCIPVISEILFPRPCTNDTDCMSPSARCIATVPPGAMGVCEIPIVPRRPAPLPGDCTANYECSDGVACNGRELCEPTAFDSDARGCHVARAGGCSVDETCDEATLSCTRFVGAGCD